MSDLLPEDQAFLDLARDADDPSDVQRDRVRRRLVTKLGVAAGLSASATTAASAAASGAMAGSVQATMLGASGLLVAKVVAVAAIVVGAGAGTVTLYRSAHGQPSSHVTMNAAPTAAPQVPVAVPAPLPLPLPLPSPPVARAAEPEPLLPTADPVTAPVLARLPHAAPVPSSVAPETAVSSQLEEETGLVQAGDAALRAGDAASALALFDKHARAFPAGVLAEERAAERVLALCALGREEEARVDAARFLRERPSAPLAAKVRESCGGSSSEAH